jgi:3-deoxy-D-manno-octulosonate 8-phosphate phosphatase (KDO 8-P phosphatase)
MDIIKLLVYDFDGVMTDNKLYIDQDGKEMVQVSRADGMGVSEIRKLGIEQMIISTEKNPVVAVRAKKLGLNCLQGVKDKRQVLSQYCVEQRIPIETVAFVGNDINDMEAMRMVGMTFCPADAHPDIKNFSTHVLKTPGGEGVVRELLDQLYIFNLKKDK